METIQGFVCILPFITLGLGITIIYKRHKGYVNKIIVAGLILGTFIGLIAFGVQFKVNADASYIYWTGGWQWQKIELLKKRAFRLEYNPEIGLSAITEKEEVEKIRNIPFCTYDAPEVSDYRRFEVTKNPYYLYLVMSRSESQPQLVKQQIRFNIASNLGPKRVVASSFVVDDNGEVWCTERNWPKDSINEHPMPEVLLGPVPFMVVISFVYSFMVTPILIVIFVEIFHWWQKVTKRFVTTENGI